MVNLEETLAQGVKEGKIPHAVVFATNKDGSFTYKHAVGNALIDGSKPISEDAAFQLASQTKFLTSIAALQVVDKGLIGLDEDVAKALPELAAQPVLKGFDENEKPILEKRKNALTLRHLLTHESGAIYDMIHPDLTKYKKQKDPSGKKGDTILERYVYPLVFEPGTSWTYGTGNDWAGKLVERVSGLTLEEYERKNMWEPLGITGITFLPYENPELKDKVPDLTMRTPEGKLIQHDDPFFSSKDCFGGHGAGARLGDFLKVLRSILANDGKLLKPETVDMMFEPQLSPEGKKALIGLRHSPFAAMQIGEHDPDIDVDYGLAGMLFLQDDVGRRKKNTLFWGGMANTFWIIDREADIALTFGTQVLPQGDKLATEMITATELAVYEMAGVKF